MPGRTAALITVLMARPARPVELVPPCVMLASDKSTYITGGYIRVTGDKPTF